MILITDDLLADLKKLAKAATEGPWHLMANGFSAKRPSPTVYATDDDLRYIARCEDFSISAEFPETDNKANAAFIAAANPAVALALIERIESLENTIDEMIRDERP